MWCVFLYVCLFVRLWISPLRIKLAASNFARRLIGVQGRESHILTYLEWILTDLNNQNRVLVGIVLYSNLQENDNSMFFYPHMPISKVWIYRLLFVCLFVCNFVRWRISPARIKLAASNFARWFVGVLGRESPILGNFAPQKPKIRPIDHPPGSKVQCWNGYSNRQRWQRVRSACVDNVRPRRRTYLSVFCTVHTTALQYIKFTTLNSRHQKLTIKIRE